MNHKFEKDFLASKNSWKENELVFNYSYIGDKAGMCFHPNKLGETFVDLSVLKDPSFFILPPPPPPPPGSPSPDLSSTYLKVHGLRSYGLFMLE